jgi:phage regulator Rha-like protein
MNDVENKIVIVRNERVILDCDVATLYGVTTKEINQAVRNNPEKFPKGYIFQTTIEEKKEVVKNFDHLEKLKFSPVNPTAFTERGLYMLATILKGKVATQTTIKIIDTFVEIRELSRMVASVPKTTDEIERKSLLKRSGEIISNVLTSDLEESESETEIELNFAMLKIKHKVKKERKK